MRVVTLLCLLGLAGATALAQQPAAPPAATGEPATPAERPAAEPPAPTATEPATAADATAAAGESAAGTPAQSTATAPAAEGGGGKPLTDAEAMALPPPAATGPTPQRFNPTEKVRADFPVSFPIDI